MITAGKTLCIGIAGGTGSGKTTITERLAETFAGKVSVLYHDSYYLARDGLPLSERAKLNYDHPDAFETDLMIRDIEKLKRGESVECPVYDYSVHNRKKDETRRVDPNSVLVVDGILVLSDPALRRLFDIKIFVDTDADVRILRRMLRDTTERGRTVESVVTQYLSTVKPMHELFVEPTKKFADLIIPEGGYNDVAIGMIIQTVADHIRKCGN
ncbi:MAG: uridine kinase [Clostridia bacterium]|nr:uridine kinase [Clostridia bacterium]